MRRPDALATLRKGFSATVKDSRFLADAKRAKLTLSALSGKQLEALIERHGQYPKKIVEAATAIVKEAGLIR